MGGIFRFVKYLSFGEKKSRRERYIVRDDVVPLTGIEPVRVLPHGILSPGRLPVPPQRQMNLLYKSTLYPYLCKLSSIFIKISGLSFSNMLSTASLCSRITWRVL